MLLESIEAIDFRNLNGSIEFDPNLNILVGENGQGKTNWLEAIAVLASGRSFRTAQLRDAINFDQPAASVKGRVRESREIARELQVVFTPRTKTLTVNGKKEVVSRYVGQLHAVVFNMDELEIVRGLPEARRRFLDDGVTSLHPPYVQVLNDYNRVIRQKSSLLHDANDNGRSVDAVRELLEPWNEQLIVLATRIHRSRVRFVERLNEVLQKHLFGREQLSVRYVSSLEEKGDPADYSRLIAERLGLRVQAELAAGRALVGPHRDEMELTFDGRDLRKFGSAGQQSSALLLLQLANVAVFHATHGEYPLFLLDDIDAELDYRRIGKLVEYLHGKTQTFVTTSKDTFAEKFGQNAFVFSVSEGAAKRA